MTVTLSDRVRPAPEVVFRALGDEAVVVSLDDGLYFGLDAVAARIWSLCADHDLAGVADALTQEFDVETERARTDVVAFVGQLVERRLVIRVGDA